jgi:hypothetical protein
LAKRKSVRAGKQAKGNKQTMKKLMIVAAAAAMVASVQAAIGIKTINCHYNPESGCPEKIFKVTGSGKAIDRESKNYTTVSKLKINGWLVLFPNSDEVVKLADGTTQTNCCWDTYSLYVNAKVGKKTTGLIFAGAGNEPVNAWTVFGKKLDSFYNAEKGKKFKLESQLGISADYTTNGGQSSGTLVYADDLAGNVTPGIAFIASAFGKMTYRTTTTSSCNSCNKTTKTVTGFEFTPGSYSGWFAGMYDGETNEDCLTCICTDLNLFGGTWKAKYQTKVGTWEAAARDIFGAKVAAEMGEASDFATE